MSERLEELKEAAAEQSGHGKSPVVIGGSRLLALVELAEAQHEGLKEWESECRLGMMGDKGEEALALYNKFNGGKDE